MDPTTAAVLGIVLQSPLTEYTMCFNDSCVKYECDLGPSYTHEAGVTRVHAPCLSINIVCNDVEVEVCSVSGATIEQMPNKQGIIITGVSLREGK